MLQSWGLLSHCLPDDDPCTARGGREDGRRGRKEGDKREEGEEGIVRGRRTERELKMGGEGERRVIKKKEEGKKEL